MTGSTQYRRYIAARDFDHARADAAAYAPISIGEAELIDAEREAEDARAATRRRAV